MNGRGLGRGKVTPKWRARMRALQAEGASVRAIRNQLAREGLRISPSGVHQALAREARRQGGAPSGSPLDLDTLEARQREKLSALLSEASRRTIVDGILEGGPGVAAKVARALADLIEWSEQELARFAADELGEQES